MANPSPTTPTPTTTRPDTPILRVELAADLTPEDRRVVMLFEPLLLRGWHLAFYRAGTRTPFCLAHGEPEGIRLAYYA